MEAGTAWALGFRSARQPLVLRRATAGTADSPLRVAAGSSAKAVSVALCKKLESAGPTGEVVVDSMGTKSLYTTIKATIYTNGNIKSIAGAPDGQQVGAYVSKEPEVGPNSTIYFYRHRIRFASTPTDQPGEVPLLAKSKSNVGKLAGAIAGRIRKGGAAVVEAIGEAVSQAVKSVVVAEEYLQKEGKAGHIFAVPQFADITYKAANGTDVSLKRVQLRCVLA